MEDGLVLICTLGFLASIVAVIYPYKPFRTRKRALLGVVGFVIAVPIVAPSPENRTAPGDAANASASPAVTASAERQIIVPSDAKAKYFVYDLAKRDDGMVEISTRREGPSGTSYTVRLVQCSPLRFATLADGETREGLVRATSPDFSELVTGSISDVVSRYACDPPAQEVAVTPLAPYKTAAATSARVVAKIDPREEGRRQDVRDSLAVMRWDEATILLRDAIGLGLATDEFRDEIEKIALDQVRPLPSSEREKNLGGYKFLAMVRPDNSSYADKVSQYEAAIKAERLEVVTKLRKSEDKVEGITWYKHPNQPKYTNSRSTAYLYIGRKGENGRPWLRMVVQYTSNDWLFVRTAHAWHDGIKEPLVLGGFERDNNSTIWEWADVSPDEYQMVVLKSLANAKEAIIRFEGQQYKRDVTLSSGDKRAILDVLAAYEALQNAN